MICMWWLNNHTKSRPVLRECDTKCLCKNVYTRAAIPVQIAYFHFNRIGMKIMRK